MIQLRTLGGIDLISSEGRDLRSVLHQPKRIALLTYLAVAGREDFVRRDKIIALFWPELDSEHARGALRSTLHRFRVTLGDNVLCARADELRVDPVVIDCDANRVYAAAERGDHERVLSDYRGEFLDGLFAAEAAPELDDWIDKERRRLRALAVNAAWNLSEAAEAAGDRRRALTMAQRAHELEGDASAQTRALLERLRNSAPAGVPVVATLPPLVTELSQAPAPVAAATRRTPRIAAAILLPLSLGAVYALARQARATPASATTWEQVKTDGNDPMARAAAIAVLDSTSQRLLLFSGRSGDNNVGDLWRLSLGGTGTPARWTRVRTAGDPSVGPGERFLSAAAYNRRTDRLILFGGALGYTTPCANDLWILRDVSSMDRQPSWQEVRRPAGAAWPAARGEHGVGYDSEHNRLMLFGGHDCVAPVFTDYWVLRDADGSTGTPTWERIIPDTSEGQPRGARGQAIAYSPATNRLIVFGGFDYPRSEFLNDTWTLTNANGLTGRPAWKRLKVDGPLPPARSKPAFGFDPSTDRLVVAMGGGRDGPLSDGWVLIGADGATPRARWMSFAPNGDTSALVSWPLAVRGCGWSRLPTPRNPLRVRTARPLRLTVNLM